MSYCDNIERGGSRVSVELESFAASVLSKTHGVGRGYVYYQSCRHCKAHEAVILVDPNLWHETDAFPAPQWEPSQAFACATGLPYAFARLVLQHDSPAAVQFNDQVVGVGDFWDALWEVHTAHAQWCGAPLHDPVHRNGTQACVQRWHNGELRINDLFRAINGVAHTDTDLLLVDSCGRPLLVVEDYHPGSKKKRISFSKSMSVRSGGSLVAKVCLDDDPSGPWIEEVWDVRGTPWTQVIRPEYGVRGYAALERVVMSHPSWQHHINLV